jgi:hypothetical protein
MLDLSRPSEKKITRDCRAILNADTTTLRVRRLSAGNIGLYGSEIEVPLAQELWN